MILGYKGRENLAPWLTGRNAGEFGDLEADHAQLCEWLRTATRGLAASAKERIQMEIGAHYSEALTAHVVDGLSESEAKVAAVAELGDAKAAAKRFRKRHLTVEEADAAASYFKIARSVWTLLVMYLFFSFVVHMDRGLLPAKNHLPPNVYFTIGFLTLVVIPTACFFVARRNRSNQNTCWLILIESGALYVWVLTEFFTSQGPGHGWWFLVNGLLYASFMVVRPFRLWYKLRRAGDDWQEMPPRNAASS